MLHVLLKMVKMISGNIDVKVTNYRKLVLILKFPTNLLLEVSVNVGIWIYEEIFVNVIKKQMKFIFNFE